MEQDDRLVVGVGPVGPCPSRSRSARKMRVRASRTGRQWRPCAAAMYHSTVCRRRNVHRAGLRRLLLLREARTVPESAQEHSWPSADAAALLRQVADITAEGNGRCAGSGRTAGPHPSTGRFSKTLGDPRSGRIRALPRTGRPRLGPRCCRLPLVGGILAAAHRVRSALQPCGSPTGRTRCPTCRASSTGWSIADSCSRPIQIGWHSCHATSKQWRFAPGKAVDRGAAPIKADAGDGRDPAPLAGARPPGAGAGPLRSPPGGGSAGLSRKVSLFARKSDSAACLGQAPHQALGRTRVMNPMVVARRTGGRCLVQVFDPLKFPLDQQGDPVGRTASIRSSKLLRVLFQLSINPEVDDFFFRHWTFSLWLYINCIQCRAVYREVTTMFIRRQKRVQSPRIGCHSAAGLQAAAVWRSR